MIGALGGAVKEDVMNTFDAWNPASVACENQSMNHSGAQPSTRRVVCGGNHIRYVARPGELQCATVQAKMTVAQPLRGNLRRSSLLHRRYYDLASKLPDLRAMNYSSKRYSIPG
jgi:hypothetical protein